VTDVRSITPDHQELLLAAAIDLVVAEEAGVRSVLDPAELPAELSKWRRCDGVTPGLLFPVRSPEGAVVHQYRPDSPVVLANGNQLPKYLFPSGTVPAINVHPRMVDMLDTAGQVVIAEGTKQYLAAVSCAEPNTLVLGVSGCWGWSRDGAPSTDLMSLHLAGRDVVVIFDADVGAKFAVWSAADRLAGVLADLGAGSVRFARLNAGGSAGLDDYLARVPVGARRDVLARMIANAPAKLPRRPAKGSGGGSGEGVTPEDAERLDGAATATDDGKVTLFNGDGLMAEALRDYVIAGGNFALGRNGNVWVYRDGVYVDDHHDLVRRTQVALGDRWRGMHHRNLLELLTAHLAGEGLALGDSPLGDLVNLRNGMLNPITGVLYPHDPGHLSYAQLPVEWDPAAKCPKFDAWLAQRCGHQAGDLLESVALMLTPASGQRKAVFLFGPSRSGKGTFLRIIERIAGDYVSALTLHQLTNNRFAAAGLYGKVLNSAGDLSDHHVDDLSVFKMLTGDDPVAAEAKFRDPFTFHNKALFIFSANTPPTVSETSRAYLNRMAPFLFPFTFAGEEDQRIEEELVAELPGILVRLVQALRRWHDRGGYAPGDPMVADSFAQQSDVAALFVAQVVAADPGGFTTGAAMYDVYVDWARSNGRHTLGRNKFLRRVDVVLGERVRRDGRTGGTGWPDVRALGESEWIDADPCASFASFVTTSLHEDEFVGDDGGGSEEGVREGEVGAERAKDAQPPDDQVDPDDVIVVEF
jgi:putative DNA primase/helicase